MEDFNIGEKYKIKVVLNSEYANTEDLIETNFIGRLIYYKLKYEEEYIYNFCSLTYITKNTYFKFEVVEKFDDFIGEKYVNIIHKYRHEGAKSIINDNIYLIGFDNDKKEFDTFTYLSKFEIKPVL